MQTVTEKLTNKIIVEQAIQLQNELGDRLQGVFGLATDSKPLGLEVKYKGSEGVIFSVTNKTGADILRAGVKDQISEQQADSTPKVILLPFSKDNDQDYYEAGFFSEGLFSADGGDLNVYIQEGGSGQASEEVKILMEAATKDNPDMAIFLIENGLYTSQIPPKSLGERKVIDHCLNNESLYSLLSDIQPGYLTEDDYVRVFENIREDYPGLELDIALGKVASANTITPSNLEDLFLYKGDKGINREILGMEKLKRCIEGGVFGHGIRQKFWKFEHRNTPDQTADTGLEDRTL